MMNYQSEPNPKYNSNISFNPNINYQYNPNLTHETRNSSNSNSNLNNVTFDNERDLIKNDRKELKYNFY